MNPDTNQFEKLHAQIGAVEQFRKEAPGDLNAELQKKLTLLRPDGTQVPEHWSIFKIDEEVQIKGHIFRVAYIGETSILFEPVRPANLDDRCPVESPQSIKEA